MLKRVITILTFLLAFIAAHATAQVTGTVTYDGTNKTVYWDSSSPASTAPDDVVVAYVLEANTAPQTGNTTTTPVKSWTVTGTATQFTLPTAEVPARPFYLSVRAVSQASLKSAHSNTLLFREPGTPTAPARLRTTPAP